MLFLLSLLLAITLHSPIISAKSGCSTSRPCGEGGGDCDRDSHCRARLKCGRNNCDNSYGKGWDCCYDSSKTATETCNKVVATATAGYGICAALAGGLCPFTLGLSCAVSAGCLGGAAVTQGGRALACRKRRAVGGWGLSQEEALIQSQNHNAILQQLEFRNYRESLEDWAIASVDLHLLVRETSAEQAVTKILMVDQAYKRLEKTPKFRLLKENDPEVDKFGKTAMESWIPQRVLLEFLSGNSTLYGAPQKRCGMETANAFEALLLKGSVFHFMGQQIVDKKEPLQDQIDDLKAILQTHKTAYHEHCSAEEIVMSTKDVTLGVPKSFNDAQNGKEKENYRLK